MMTIQTLLALPIAMFVGVGVAPAQEAAPAPQPAEHASPETADELLIALERADESLDRLQSDITFIKEFEIAGDLEVRNGQLVYERTRDDDGEPRKRFAVRFDKFLTGNRVGDDLREYVFDGEWFVEKFISDKEFVKRQVVPPGEQWDPMKLGEGPFPVPIGQRRADVLREWVAELAPATEGVDHPKLVEQAVDHIQLRLVPRPELADKAEYEEVRVWYDRKDLLPRMLKATNFAGDSTTVVLRQIACNEDAAFGAEAISTAPPREAGWNVTIEPWQGTGSTRVDTRVEVEGGK